MMRNKVKNWRKQFSRNLWQLKFTGKMQPAPFRGAKQAKFKVTGKKVRK